MNDLDRARERRRQRAGGPIGGFYNPPVRTVLAMDRARRKMLEADARAGRVAPNPQRITLALDAQGLYGPEVDAACGVEEPAVDEWEAGQRIPTVEQVEALARLTGFPFMSFYIGDPMKMEAGHVFICQVDL